MWCIRVSITNLISSKSHKKFVNDSSKGIELCKKINIIKNVSSRTNKNKKEIYEI